MNDRRYPLEAGSYAEHMDGRFCRILDITTRDSLPAALVQWKDGGMQEIVPLGYLRKAFAETAL